MKLPQAYVAASAPATSHSSTHAGKKLHSRIDMSAEVVLASKCPECKGQMRECHLEGDLAVNACVGCRIALPKKDDDGEEVSS